MIHKVNGNTTIQSAIDLARPGDTIEIANGVYEEKIRIETPGIRLVGESKDGCKITFGDYALKQLENGEKYGTFRSYSCLIMADDVTMENLTIENSAGDGREVGQAIALYAEGDRLQFINCNLLGHQDTLFTAPLPEKPVIPGSFAGPSEDNAYKRCRQYYRNCFITGDVDFIFGSALALFDHCQLVTRNRQCEINGYVTAPSTWQGEPYGFVFVNCGFVGEAGIDPGTVYFGRPWRPYGQTMLIGCSYDECIHEDHWDYWGKESNRETARFSEYGTIEMRGMDFLDPWHIEKIVLSEIERIGEVRK